MASLLSDSLRGCDRVRALKRFARLREAASKAGRTSVFVFRVRNPSPYHLISRSLDFLIS
jgi:hypothetical protein